MILSSVPGPTLYAASRRPGRAPEDGLSQAENPTPQQPPTRKSPPRAQTEPAKAPDAAADPTTPGPVDPEARLRQAFAGREYGLDKALETLARPYREGDTRFQERVDAAIRLSDRLGLEAAARAAGDLAAASAGGATSYQADFNGETLIMDGEPQARPYAEAVEEYRQLLERIQTVPFRKDRSPQWGDDGRAMLAYATLNSELRQPGEGRQDFLDFLGLYGSATTALGVTRALEQAAPEHRPALRKSLRNSYLNDAQGKPRSWAPSGAEAAAASLLYYASLLEPGQSVAELELVRTRLQPRVEEYHKLRSKRFTSYQPCNRDLSYAAENYRDPGEPRLQVLERHLGLCKRLWDGKIPPGDESQVLGGIGRNLEAWRGRLPGRSAGDIFRTVVQALVGAVDRGFPPEHLSTLSYQLPAQMRPEEPIDRALDRLTADYHTLEKRLHKHGKDVPGAAFTVYVNYAPARPPEFPAELAEQWVARRGTDNLSSVLYNSRELHQAGDTPADLVARLEDNLNLTGRLSGIPQARALLPAWVKSGHIPAEVAERHAADLEGWMGGLSLMGSHDATLDALKALPGEDLARAMKAAQGADPAVVDALMAGLAPGQRLVDVTAGLARTAGEVMRVGKQAGYREEALRGLIHDLLRSEGHHQLSGLARFLEAVGQSPQKPPEESLGQVAAAAREEQETGCSLAAALERVGKSHYLTGSYNGLTSARAELARRMENGRFRGDVTLDTLFETLTTHVHQLRVAGTEPEKTVPLALERLASSHWAVEPESGALIAEKNGSLLVGGSVLKLRSRS